jgi:hypothetical protein
MLSANFCHPLKCDNFGHICIKKVTDFRLKAGNIVACISMKIGARMPIVDWKKGYFFI